MPETAGHLKRSVKTVSSWTLDRVSRVFGPWVDMPENCGAGKRTRLFSPSVTFWLFLLQVLDEKGSCREALRRFHAWLSFIEGKTASASTAAYCKARARLQPVKLAETNEKIVTKIGKACPWLWHSRRVMVVDGTGLSMPDTPENQGEWPQAKCSKPGCGFPLMRVVAIFSLAAGTLTDFVFGPLAVHERTLFRVLWRSLRKGDILLGDRGFGSFAEFFLLAQKGVDCVMRKNARRKNGRTIRKNGKNDHIVEWIKSGNCPKWLSLKTWHAMPIRILVREIEVIVEKPGFRTKRIFVVTTLLDSREFPASDIAGLHLRRWNIELFFRNIKTTMGMDILSCRSPGMIEIELWMYVIAHNLVRALMMESALRSDTPISRISFKGTISTLRQWTPFLAVSGRETSITRYFLLLDYIARDKLPYRPNRMEPRARKRRPKAYQLLNKPRAEFKEIPHRNKYKKP